MSEVVQMERNGGVATIRMNRPDRLNAYNAEMGEALLSAVSEASAEPSVRCVVLTGTGKAFSAGGDVESFAAFQDEGPTKFLGMAIGLHALIATLRRSPKPVVAAVNGVAVGVGTTMFPYCDLVLASSDARFRLPFASLGVVPEAGSSWTLPTVMGWQAAAHVLFTAEWLSAPDALACGLVWKVVEPEALLHDALEVAGKIAKMPVVSLVETKRLLMASRLDAARSARVREEEVFSRLTGAPANREAIAAFLEKREADFTNLARE